MKDGANVLDVGVPSRDLSRVCRGTLPACTNVPPKEVCDCVRACDEGEVVMPESGEAEKATDLGLPMVDGAGETEAFLEKGLLRVCAIPLETILLADCARYRKQGSREVVCIITAR